MSQTIYCLWYLCLSPSLIIDWSSTSYRYIAVSVLKGSWQQRSSTVWAAAFYVLLQSLIPILDQVQILTFSSFLTASFSWVLDNWGPQQKAFEDAVYLGIQMCIGGSLLPTFGWVAWLLSFFIYFWQVCMTDRICRLAYHLTVVPIFLIVFVLLAFFPNLLVAF